MNGGVGGTGSPHLATLYDRGTGGLKPEGNPFEWILQQAKAKRERIQAARPVSRYLRLAVRNGELVEVEQKKVRKPAG